MYINDETDYSNSLAINNLTALDAAVPEPTSIIIWSLFGLGTVFGVRVWRRGRKAT
jgi:hypothetical protein